MSRIYLFSAPSSDACEWTSNYGSSHLHCKLFIKLMCFFYYCYQKLINLLYYTILIRIWFVIFVFWLLLSIVMQFNSIFLSMFSNDVTGKIIVYKPTLTIAKLFRGDIDGTATNLLNLMVCCSFQYHNENVAKLNFETAASLKSLHNTIIR